MRRLEPAVDDRARIAAPSRLGEEGDDGRGRDDLGRLDGEQIGIAGADPDAVETAKRAHSMSLASALTAAAAIALPPLRPRMTMAGRPLSINASFDSAAPTKPTGMPMIAAGRGAPAEISSRSRNKAVGALPIATTEPPRRGSQSSIAAAVRVVPSFAASSGVEGSESVQITSLFAGGAPV